MENNLTVFRSPVNDQFITQLDSGAAWEGSNVPPVLLQTLLYAIEHSDSVSEFYHTPTKRASCRNGCVILYAQDKYAQQLST